MINLLLKGIKSSSKWCLPYGILDLIYKHRKRSRKMQDCLNVVGSEGLKSLANNLGLKNIHKGKRCFILGSGPSINKQNMHLLKGEQCIFLNEFYFHKDFTSLLPAYYLHAGIYIHNQIPESVWIKAYREMERVIPISCVMFLNCLDRKLIIKNELFKKHQVHYFLFKKDIENIFVDGIDMSSLLYSSSNVVSMAMQIALYMGFSEIYLLGFEGGRQKESDSLYFYDEDKTLLAPYISKKLGVSRYHSFSEMERAYGYAMHFFKQLRILQAFAKERGVKIYNASGAGIIDFFPMVKFEELFF